MSSTTHTRPPGPGSREPAEGEGAEFPSLAPWEAPGAPPGAEAGPEAPLSALPPLVEEARGAASAADRAALAERINRHLDALPAGGGSREVADLLEQLLEGGELAGLVEAEGRSCRAAATEALTRLGFPFALEVRPEDLAHLRGEDSGSRGSRWRDLEAAGVLGAGILGQWVLMLHSTADFGSPLPLILLMGLSLLALVPGVLAPERSASRRAGLVVLAVLAIIQVLSSVLVGYPAAVSGLAGLLACLLLWLPRR